MISEVRELWRGNSIVRRNGIVVDVNISVLPRPIQKELPVWLTTSGRRGFEFAASLGVNVLTSLISQSTIELADNITLYRETLAKCGHDPSLFNVTVVIHTLVAETESAALAASREPLRRYLASHAQLRENLTRGTIFDQLGNIDRDLLIDEMLKRYLQLSLMGFLDLCAVYRTASRYGRRRDRLPD